MLKISVFNGIGSVWSGEDWEKLRKEHRIVGNLTGSLANLPRQDTFRGLPVTLLSEETTLLLEKKFAQINSYPSLTEPPTAEIQQAFCNYKEKNQKEQIEHFDKERKKQVSSIIDRIIEGKRKKSLGICTKKSKVIEVNLSEEEISNSSDVIIDREEILNNELNKGITIAPANLLVQTFTDDPWIEDNKSEIVEWKFPATLQEKLRYSVFKDLWEKGYFISSGSKFGGDFLVYPGDPIKFHAQFIVLCVDSETKMPAPDIIVYGRLGSTTRKTFVIATQLKNSDQIVYQSLQWSDKS